MSALNNTNVAHNPLDRNFDGKVDLKDLRGNNANTGMTHNPLDRNFDGKVDARDLKGNNATTGMTHNPLDRNFDGKVDMRDLKGNNAGVHHNPLDRNFDGKVDARDFVGQSTMVSQGAYIQTEKRASLVRAAPTIVETVQKEVVIQERIHPVQKEEIQPIIYREREQLDVKQVTQMMHETQIQPTIIQQRELPAQRREAVVERGASLVRAEPTIIETIQKDVVIQERIHPVQKEEIQPIIYREREQLDVKQVTQLMHETQIQPTIIQQRELPAERREAIVERGAAITENYIAASREVDAVSRTQVVHAPIVQEVIKKTIIEEIQPVLERDIIQSTIIQNTQPIYEKIVEAPTVLRSTTIVQDRGFIGGDLAALEAQGFVLGEAGKRLSATYSSQTIQTGLAAPLAGQTYGMTSAPLASETLATSHGLKRRSLVEALPASYGYLGNGLDSKIVQEEMRNGAALNHAALPSKTVL
ncbi:hypothetical protein PROFUN_02106 [Planoprotostelium fungivorum]|uniref:Uncharacterized protein n=1 Tax=Planoprotostelium fungivorum TaxID=1890364 RepID=A0A2P6NZ55_9EUKA|nr:hypothetical protein PROFUN_02106 [Planoprotostelium fungivorum]